MLYSSSACTELMSARLAAIEFVLDDVEQPAMQTLHQRQGLEIERADVFEPAFPIGRFDRLGNGLHDDASLCYLLSSTRPCFPRRDAATLPPMV